MARCERGVDQAIRREQRKQILEKTVRSEKRLILIINFFWFTFIFSQFIILNQINFGIQFFFYDNQTLIS
jgi:hypothetical protein